MSRDRKERSTIEPIALDAVLGPDPEYQLSKRSICLRRQPMQGAASSLRLCFEDCFLIDTTAKSVYFIYLLGD